MTAIPSPTTSKPSDQLDVQPLGTAEEERKLAKAWMDTAAQHLRNEEYWRDQRALPAERCVRMFHKISPSITEVNALFTLPQEGEVLRTAVLAYPPPEDSGSHPKVNLAPEAQPPTTMNFGGALAALKQGKHVTRQAWSKGTLFMEMPDGPIRIAYPSPNSWPTSPEDLLAEDWTVLP